LAIARAGHSAALRRSRDRRMMSEGRPSKLVYRCRLRE
jgi:hypothetical protein